MAFLPPNPGEVYAALEVRYVDLRPLFHRLHKQQLQQYALSAARGAAQQDMGDVGEVHRHRPRQAFPQHQHKAVRGQIFVFPGEQGRKIALGGDGIDTDDFPPLRPCHFRYGDIQGRFNPGPLVLPLPQRYATGVKLPERQPGRVLVPLLAQEDRGLSGVVDKAHLLQALLCLPAAPGCSQEYQDGQEAAHGVERH